MVPLAPSASVLGLMLSACEDFASSNSLLFVTLGLVLSGSVSSHLICVTVASPLSPVCSVTHLGNKLMNNLYNGDNDIF